MRWNVFYGCVGFAILLAAGCADPSLDGYWGCETDEQCGSGWVCNQQTGYCEEEGSVPDIVGDVPHPADGEADATSDAVCPQPCETEDETLCDGQQVVFNRPDQVPHGHVDGRRLAGHVRTLKRGQKVRVVAATVNDPYPVLQQISILDRARGQKRV